MSQVLLVFFITLSTSGAVDAFEEVKHAPTVEQCQADQRLWLDKLENSPEHMSQDFRTLHGSQMEMGDCETVDPANQARYYNVEGEIEAVMATRLQSFIERHGLFGKFLEEDKARKR